MNELNKRGDAGQVFDYGQVDGKMAEFLREKESNILAAYEKMIESVGAELKQAQDRLAGNNQYNGVFEKWYTALGFSKRTVYNYIGYFSVVQQVHEQKLNLDIDSLPKKLVYEIGSQSSESTESKQQAKQAVLTGEVKSYEEYRELEEKLRKEIESRKATEQAKINSDARAERAEREADMLRDTLETAEGISPEVEVRTEYVEVPDLETKEKLRRYEELFGDVSMYEGRTTRVTNGDAITYTVFEFSEDVRKFIEKYGHLTHFAWEFNEMIGEGKQEYMSAINAMYAFLKGIEKNIDVRDVIIVEEELQ